MNQGSATVASETRWFLTLCTDWLGLITVAVRGGVCVYYYNRVQPVGVVDVTAKGSTFDDKWAESALHVACGRVCIVALRL